MTESDWRDEVQDAIAGTMWSIFSASTVQESSMCYAHLDHEALNRQTKVGLTRDRFPTPETRKAEIRRQLGLP